MRMIVKIIAGDLYSAVDAVNTKHSVRFVFSFHYDMVTKCTNIIFKFEDYPSYLYFCEKWKMKPMSTTEFFGD